MIEKEMFIKNGKVIRADDVYLDPRDATIEAQAAEIERLRGMVLEGAAKNAAEIVRLELEIEHLKDVYSSATECFLEAQAEIERLHMQLKAAALWTAEPGTTVAEIRAALGETK
jgi:chromosome segregation ATPase